MHLAYFLQVLVYSVKLSLNGMTYVNMSVFNEYNVALNVISSPEPKAHR